MTCAKAVVTARLLCRQDRTGHDSKYYIGNNSCRNPQDFCPREPGEGYLKCLSICRQPMHAEIDAIWQAQEDGAEPRGGHMVIFHDRCCENCQKILEQYRITWELKPK
jgi:deoxycytidylate deaminase